jgi:SPP1 gp7 family putative phage head morphogenesis protein
MPQAVPPGFTIGASQPADAMNAFAQRGLLQPTFNWHDLWEAEHAGKFMVAGVAQADVLQLFKGEIDKALASGSSLADFAKAVRPELVKKGWWGDIEITDPSSGEIRTTRFDAARLQLIYDTNLRQSYAAGRWADIERTKKTKPFITYRTMRDERVRTSHRPWDGLVLPVDDAFWAEHYPPNGWRCRCRAYSISQRALDRMVADGEPVQREAPPVARVPYRDPRTGETSTTPVGVDPGFGYNPGKSYLAHTSGLQRQALDRAAPELAAAQVAQQIQTPNFSRFMRAPLPDEAQPVAVVQAARRLLPGVASRTLVLQGKTAQAQAAPGSLASLDWVQQTLDAGAQFTDGADNVVIFLERDGWVSVLHVQAKGAALDLVRFRRVAAGDAIGNIEIERLRKLSNARKGN